MPYLFLVSALGAIAATAIAMFGIRTWSATEIAPFVGAVVGLDVAVVTLRLRRLPFGASFEDYKAAGKNGALPAGAPLYFNIALRTAVIVSIIETPLLFVSQANAQIIFPSGWIVMCGQTFYEVWKLNQQRLLNNDLDIFKLVAGIPLIGLAVGMIYFLHSKIDDLPVISRWDLIKSGFIFNPLLSFVVAILAYFAMSVIGAIRDTD